MDYKKSEEFIENYTKTADDILKENEIFKRLDDVRELGLKIENLLLIIYSKDINVPKNFTENYQAKLVNAFYLKNNDSLKEIVGYFKRILSSAQDYIELKKCSDVDFQLIDKIEKDVKFQKAEAERREAVKDAKEAGATIELIQALRDELKRKSYIENSINEIKSEIKEIKDMLKNKG